MTKSKFLQSAWFRFLKVLYGFGWLLVFAITLLIFLLTKPQGRVFPSLSGFTCPNNKSYSWTSLTGYYYEDNKILNNEDHMSAMITCEIIKGTDEVLVHWPYENDGKPYAVPANSVHYGDNEWLYGEFEGIRKNPPYKLNWITDNQPSYWSRSIGKTLLAFIVSYLVLDTIKNIIMYIAIGQRFSYRLLSWLSKQ